MNVVKVIDMMLVDSKSCRDRTNSFGVSENGIVRKKSPQSSIKKKRQTSTNNNGPKSSILSKKPRNKTQKSRARLDSGDEPDIFQNL